MRDSQSCEWPGYQLLASFGISSHAASLENVDRIFFSYGNGGQVADWR